MPRTTHACRYFEQGVTSLNIIQWCWVSWEILSVSCHCFIVNIDWVMYFSRHCIEYKAYQQVWQFFVLYHIDVIYITHTYDKHHTSSVGMIYSNYLLRSAIMQIVIVFFYLGSPFFTFHGLSLVCFANAPSWSLQKSKPLQSSPQPLVIECEMWGDLTSTDITSH